MKKKLIALLCAISMLATSVVAIAEDAEVSEATAEEVIEQVAEETEEAPEEIEEETVVEETVVEDEEAVVEETEEIVEETEEIIEEEIAEESEELPVEETEETIEVMVEREISSGGDGGGTAVSKTVEAADKTALEALIANAESITEEMVSEKVFSDIAKALDDAKATFEDEEATQDDVDAEIAALEAKLKPAVKETRDALFEATATYKGLDKGILDPTLYGAYDKAYKAGKTGFWDAEKTAAELYTLAKNIADTFNAAKDAMVATEKVLTGNVMTEADKAYYPDAEADTLPNLSYTWRGVGTTGPNPEASGQDAGDGYTRLLSGVGATPYDNIPNICWGKWGWMGTTYLDFDLGEEAYITGADFWENAGGAAGTNYCSDEIEVYTSDDESVWTLQKAVVVDQSDTPNSLKGTRVDFDDAVKCRYVRIAVIDRKGYQIKYNEVVIRGFRTTQEVSAPVVIDNIDYATTGSKGERVISLDGQKRVKVTGNVKNTEKDPKNVIVVSVAYKDGDVLDLRYVKKELTGYGSDDFTNTMQLDEQTGITLHTFVWDSFGSATPLSDIYTFGLDEHEMAEFAAEDAGAEFDIGSERLRVWGNADNKGNLKDNTLIVLTAGITNEDIDKITKTTDVLKAIVYLEQTTPEDKKFAFESFPADTTKYYGNNNVYVTTPAGDQTFYRVLYLDQNGQKELMDEFHGATRDTMRGVINSNEFLIKGVKAVDEIIAKYDKDTVLNSVAGMILDTEYETGAELLAEILAAVALTDLNNVDTKDEAIESIDKYAEEFGISKNGIYTELYSGEDYVKFKNKVSEKFVGQGYASIKDFIAEFCETIVVDMLNEGTNYTDVEKVLFADKEYMEGIGLNVEDYDKLKSAKQIRVQKQVIGHGKFKSVDDIVEEFNDAVKNPGSDKTYGDKSSGGGGGGGSSFSKAPSLGSSVPLSGVVAEDVIAFKDLADAEWARESILALYEKGIVSGTSGNTFAPTAEVTREQYIKMLIDAFEMNNASAECAFGDVMNDAWYYKAVASAVELGIVYGVSNDSFGVGEKITRQDMAVLAYRALVAQGNKVLYDKSQIADFTDDVEISEYAREAVYAMRGNGVMQGRGNNEFQPKGYATRAEAAKIIYSIMGK